MLRLSLKKLEYFFLETKYLCSWASSLGINSYYWPNTRFNQFQPLDFDYRHISCGDLSLVFAGRIAKEKGFYKVASLIEKYPFISVSLFGPIDDDSIRSSINSSNRLKYMGIIPNDQLIRQMRSFDALVLPTSWVAEGYPGVVLEAAFSGVPAIVSKEVRGPVELVEELGAGWVIDFSNSNEIEYALRDLKNNFSHEFRVRLSINVNNKFNSNRVFENIWELLI